MVDTINNKPIRVLTLGTSGPFMDVPLPRLDDLKALLDANGVRYWVNEMAISLDGRNYSIVVDFGRDGDSVKIQSLLDTVG